MRKEGPPFSLPQLTQEQERLEHILAQRKDIFDATQELTPEETQSIIIEIDFNERVASINGRSLEGLQDEARVAFCYLAQNARKDVFPEDISRALREAGLRDQDPTELIRHIREAVGALGIENVDPLYLIATNPNVKDSNLAYRLNAVVVPRDSNRQSIEFPKQVCIPSYVLEQLTPMRMKAVASLPFLAAFPPPRGFGITLDTPTRQLYPGITQVTPNDPEWANTRTFIFSAGKVLRDNNFAVWSYRPSGETQNRFFTTTIQVATQLDELRKRVDHQPHRVRRPENLQPYLFPNGEEIALTQNEISLANALLYYPQPGLVGKGELINILHGQEIDDGKILASGARKRVGNLVGLARNTFLKAGVVIINTAPRKKAEGRWSDSNFFAVAVNRDELLSETEALTGRVVTEKYIRHKGLLRMEELERAIFAGEIDTMTQAERERLRPVWARRIMAEFAAQYIKAVNGDLPELREKLTGLMESPARQDEKVRLLYKMLTSIGQAESYFFAQERNGLTLVASNN